MDKTRLYFLIILASLLIFLGLAVRQPGVLLLAAPLLVYLGAATALAPQHVRLRAERRLSVRLPSGMEQGASPPAGTARVIPALSQVTVRVMLENTGAGLSELVVADEGWRRGASLATGASSEWEYTFTPKRGRYLFRDLKILAGDPFGLFAATSTLPTPTEDQPQGALLVLPEAIPLKHVPVRPSLLRGYAGPIVARAPGSGTDFYGVREYQPGDSLRHLNWRVSSQYERDLFTNQYEGERFADIGLILDARQSRNLLSPQGELFESGVIAAASLGRAFLRDGHRVSLLIYGFSMERVMPGAGRVHGERLLRALATAHPVHNFALDNLNYLPTRLFSPRSQIVFVSPLADEDFGPLVRFRALGYDVLVISPNPVRYEMAAIEANARSAHANDSDIPPGARNHPGDLGLAVRLATIERALLVRRLERFGVWVVDWAVDRPLAEALRTGLAPLRAGQRMMRY